MSPLWLSTVAVLFILWSVFMFLCGLAFGRRDEDSKDLHPCFRPSPHNDPRRLRTDYTPEVDASITAELTAFLHSRRSDRCAVCEEEHPAGTLAHVCSDCNGCMYV